MKNKGKGKVESRRILFIVALAGFFLLPTFCNPFRFFSPATHKIILITLDTTRADHLGCYRYEEIETPHLDKIASEGILFENAICQVPMTLPSHATIMTGLYPPNHGIRENTGYILRDEMKTIAEILKGEGYKTGAAISSFIISSTFFMNQGFESFDEQFDYAQAESVWSVERKAKDTVNRAIEWFEKNREEKKIFYWLHLYDPHASYQPPEPFLSKYKDHPYDGEIAYMDSEIGKFFDYLKSIGIYDDTLFIIAGDHGEGLGEHEERYHQLLIYESTMRIPLIIKSPHLQRNLKVHATVSTTDIFPTIMQACHIKEYGKVDGETLFPLLDSPQAKWKGEYYMESMAANILYNWSQLKGIRKGPWKYIDCPNPELYNLEDDRHEQNNLYLEEMEISNQLQESLRSFEASWVDGDFQRTAAKNLDEESLEKLMSLGYIGSPSSITEGSSKDPKEFWEIHRKISEATLLFNKKKLIEGVRLLNEVYPLDRENKLILFYLGKAHGELRLYEKAIDYLETLLSLYPDHLGGYKKLADIYMLKGNWKKLKETMEKAVTFFPEEAELHYKLALTLQMEKKPYEALDHLREAIRLLPDKGIYYLLSSRCYLTIGEKEKAIKEIERAAEIGFNDFSMIFNDPIFFEILDDPSMQKILKNSH